MKICWDNLEDLIFTKNGTWRNKKLETFYYCDHCKFCNEPFLSKRNSKMLFCCHSCSSSYKKDSILTKERKSKSHIGIFYKEKSPSWKCGKEQCWYDTYASRISFAEEVRRAPDNQNILEVKCKYCGKWFKPTLSQVSRRIRSIQEITYGEHGFYCSNECKRACPIFHKSKYPEGFNGESSSREVQPELRKLVLERDDYTCQKCCLNSNTSCVELHCHHIDPVKNNPIESADIDNCITLCKDCHLEVHQKDGCKTGQLANC